MCGVSKSLGGGAPTLDKYCSRPRIFCDLYNYYSRPPAPPVSTIVLDIFFHFLSYRLSISISSYHLSLATALNLLSRRETPSTWKLYPPNTLQPPPLDSDPCAVCLHLLLFPAFFRLTFAALGLHPGPCKPLGVRPFAGTSISPMPLPLLPVFFSDLWHVLVFGYL